MVSKGTRRPLGHFQAVLSMLPELEGHGTTYNSIEEGYNCEPYIRQCHNRHLGRILAQFCTGSHWLHIETGRHKKLDVNDRSHLHLLKPSCTRLHGTPPHVKACNRRSCGSSTASFTSPLVDWSDGKYDNVCLTCPRSSWEICGVKLQYCRNVLSPFPTASGNVH